MLLKRLIALLYEARYKIFKGLDQALRPDMEPEFMEIHKKCKQHTMTSAQRMYALYMATKYVVQHNIAGDMVECGVWRGGSSMVIAATLLTMNERGRKIYLYDTFTGMTKPGKGDTNYRNEPLEEIWESRQTKDYNTWCYAPLEQVRKNIYSTGYPEENLVFVKGPVEKTIPATMPESIAILRLDTDWYESTYHELRHLFPRLSMHGVLLIDDYGCLKGARDAVDKYFYENGVKILLNRIDHTGRICIKV